MTKPDFLANVIVALGPVMYARQLEIVQELSEKFPHECHAAAWSAAYKTSLGVMHEDIQETIGWCESCFDEWVVE
jgi:hypothetical protein